jgi:4'-phosphopantetheinyl transferase
MIRWLLQTSVDHPDLAAGHAPVGLLTPAEAGQYQSYLSPNRRRDWLLGRWTAKQLVQKHIAMLHGFHPALDSFAVAQEGNGAPYIAGHHPALRPASNRALNSADDPTRLPLVLSLSHSHGYAFAALCSDASGQTRVGADIEVVASQPEGFAANFFTASEQEKINAAPLSMQPRLTTATWSAKEAVLKATHLGLRAASTSVECCIAPGRPRHWSKMQVTLDPAVRDQAGVVGPLAVWWRVIDNHLLPGAEFVLTLAAFGVEL